MGPSRRTFLPLALLTVVALWLPTPGAASTRDQLDSAKQRLTALQADIQQVTAAYQAAYDRYARTVDQIHATARDIRATQARIDRVRHALSMRARSVYETGAGGALNVLLSSGTLSEFSDRLEFLGAVDRSDHDLVTVAEVQTARLQRDQQDLTSLSLQQRSLAASLRSQEAALTSRFREEQTLVDRLTQKLKAEQKANSENRLLGVRTVRGGVLATCPVAGPHSYIDSFGAPRSGGRTHQGDDIMAPRGTPVVAAQAGNAVQDPNSLGGNSVLVYGANGDYTYYAHLDSYGASGQVSAGTQIGTVGNTGDAAGGPTHLHFEYHPGGGDAVDPTPYLDAVC